MRSLNFAALAVCIFSPAGLSAVVTRSVLDNSELETAVLDGSVMRIHQVYNENFSQLGRGARSVGKAYQKYGVAYPDDLGSLLDQILEGLRHGSGSGSGSQSNQTASSNDGEVSAVPQLFDSEYLAVVQIGTPPQTLMLDFDTGSSDLWVFSSETPAREHNGQALYNVAASSTAKKLDGATWNIKYGDGSASSGDVYMDTVTIGGVTVKNQAVESATQLSSSFSNDTASSGLLGLAFSSINQVHPTQQKTFFANAQGALAMPVFTANLKKGEAGNYNFGFIDKSEYTGSISYVDVNATDGFWQFEASGYSVGNDSNAAATSFPHMAIADTGTTLLMLPSAIVEAYYAQVEGAKSSASAGGFVFPCGTALPDLTLDIGSYKAVVPAEVIEFSPADSDSFAGATVCFGGVQSSGSLPFAIYGDVFLKSQFTVFDGGNTQIGFAAKPVD